MNTSGLKFWTIFVLAFAGSHGKVSQTQSLDGTWVGRETENWYEFPSTIPGGVYSDMMDLEIIDDVFYGYNVNSTRWVGTIDWTYALNFTVDPGLLERENVNLVLEGVDTFATVLINNITVGETNNMFVRYVFDVKDVLKAEGNNTIRLYFTNAVDRSKSLYDEQLKKYRIPPECPDAASKGECHVNMARKMQASFSWDWGPSLPSMGLWKPVYLEAYDESVIRYIVPHVVDPNDKENYLLSVDTYLANNTRNNVVGTILVKIYLSHGQALYKDYKVNVTANEHGELVHSMSWLIDYELLSKWYPNGYGEQPTYKLEVTWTSGQDSEDIDVKTHNIALRFVELVQDPLDNGASFYLKVNGVPIFVKGSNEIPINILPELGQDKQQIRNLLQSAKDANMNMLRVWGGGVYESDYFYEVADELGIMIWQDFMFACALYPATEEFLDNVRAEVNHNVKRLFYHPSIVVYSGNNENEGVLVDNWFNTQNNFDQYKADYVALYIDTIASELNRVSGGTAVFISSSPTNGKLTESEGWIGQSPGNQFWGDVHYYNYASDPWDSNNYPVPRFCSEYGYQSLPFEDAWLTTTNDTDDLSISSNFMNWRQHHPNGNSEMKSLIEQNLDLPDSDSEHYSSAFIYLSQVYTAQAIKVETEHYRRYRSYLTEDGRGYTMGALYWQLNDVWVAPTWSGIDYTGRWKILHYFAKNFFENVIVTGHINSDRELQLYTVNDQLSSVENVSVVVRLYKYDSPDFKPAYENSLALALNASASQLIQTVKTDEFLKEQECDKDSCFFHFSIENNDGVALGPDNYVFPGKLKDSSLTSPTVTISSVKQSDLNSTYDITVKSDNVALFVWLNSHDLSGRFSDNGFLQVDETKVISFTSEVDTTEKELEEALTVTHLKDPLWV